MNTEQIEAALQGTAPHGSPSDDTELLTALAAQPELAEFDGQVHFLVSSWTVATRPRLAGWLRTRAVSTSASEAVADLRRYVGTTMLTGSHVMLLGGVSVPDPVVLTPDITLLPFSATNDLFWSGRVLNMYKDFHENYRPTAAIVERCAYPKAVQPPDGTLTFPDNTYRSIEDVRRCMTAIGPSSPVWLGSWTELDEWIPTFGKDAAIPNPFETGGFPRVVATPTWNDLPQVWTSWTALTEKKRAHLRVPLDRLNRALRNIPLVDAAIEIGIAADALFLGEREADRGEQTLTLKLRAARFLGANADERQQLGKLFGNLYKARSKAVHSGVLSDKTDGVDTAELLATGCNLVGTAVRRILAEGEPDWQALLYA